MTSVVHKVVGYARYSTEEQGNGHTLTTQRSAIESYCRERGLELAGIYADEAVSGTIAPSARPGLAAAMRAARKGVGVVVYRVDRLSRDVGHVSELLRWCQRGQHALHSASEGGLVDTRDPGAVTMMLMRGVLAQHERATVARRVSDALAALKASGKRAGECPWGYSALADGTLVPDAVEADVVSQARLMRLLGISLRGIVAGLAERGVVGRTGKPLGLTQIARILAV